MDRLITIKLDYFDRDTEVQISQTRSGIPAEDAGVIVDIVRDLRSLGLTKHGPSLRACIMIARLTAQQGARARLGDPLFQQLCREVLGGLTAKVVRGGDADLTGKLDALIAKHAPPARGSPRAGSGRRPAVQADPAVAAAVTEDA